MLSKSEFIDFVLGLRTASPAATARPGQPSAALETSPDDFAHGLLARCFGDAPARPIGELLTPRDEADQHHLDSEYEPGAHYWPRTETRPFHVVLVRLRRTSSAILGGSTRRTVEHELHRRLQHGLAWFERSGPHCTSEIPPASQSEILYIIAITDDHNTHVPRQLIAFGTRAIATTTLESFVLRQEVLDWDPALAREHLDAFYTRHLEPLGKGPRWQDAFITHEEHQKAKKLLDACCSLPAVLELLDEIAGSCGLPRKPGTREHRLTLHPLPENHSIAADPPKAPTKKHSRTPFQTIRVFDADDRLLGTIIHIVDSAAKLHEPNHVHNLLVIDPDPQDAKLELWQNGHPLQGSLRGDKQASQFNGEGGIVQLLSRFFVVGPTELDDAKRLAVELAWHAQHLRTIALDELRKENHQPADQRPLRDLLETFNKAHPSLDDRQFADAYAQTVTYGLLVARWISAEHHDLPFTRKHVERLLPSTSPFLRDLFARLLNSSFDPNLTWLLDDLTNLLARTTLSRIRFGKRDPSIHFYEEFLAEYDKSTRAEHGVYYTPDEVVSYIVRTTHAALQERFGLRLGLADTTSWREFAQMHDLAIPEGVDPNQPFVQILDPACGTGIFPLRVIEVIHETMTAEFTRQNLAPAAAHVAWVTYVREHLLPRLHAFELMTAPYIVTHLRLGLALQQTGFKFEEQDRLQVLLKNSLDPPLGARVAAQSTRPMSVVLGNPPYQRGAHFRGEYAEALVRPFKDAVRSERNIQPLSDNYILFLALANSYIQRATCGILAMVTNGTYLTGRLHRGLRQALLKNFRRIQITDLHGSLKVTLRADLQQQLGRQRDENIFEIQQGVAIIHAERGPGVGPSVVEHLDLTGPRPHKLAWLAAHPPRAATGATSATHRPISPSPPLFLFTSADQTPPEYISFPPLDQLFTFHNVSGKPGKDDLLVSFAPDDVLKKLDRRRRQLANGDVREPTEAERKLAARPADLPFDPRLIRRYAYRPGDTRWTYYDPAIWTRAVTSLAGRIDGSPVLLTTKIVKDSEFNHVWVTRELADVIFLSATSSVNCYSFPLAASEASNLQTARFCALLGRRIEPLTAFHYIYAILHSPTYRSRYTNALRHDFPRIPLLRSAPSGFDKIAEIGEKLVQLHLLEDPALGRGPDRVRFVDGGDRKILTIGARGRQLQRVDGVSRLPIHDRSYFEGISDAAWSFKVGGYVLLQKWLDERRKAARPLDDDDLAHFCKLADVATQTLTLMDEIDAVISAAGGWPGAFLGGEA